MGTGTKNFLEAKLLPWNGKDVCNDAPEASAEDDSKLIKGPSDQSLGESQRTVHGSDLPKPNHLALDYLAIPAPNKWRGSKIKVHNKDVIRAQKQERSSTRNSRKAQSRMDDVRSPEQEEVTQGSSSNAQADSKETTVAPGNMANGRYIYRMKNGLMSYGLGRNGLKRGKKTNGSSVTGPATPSRRVKPSPKNGRVIKPRVLGSPKENSPTVARKGRGSEVDSEECVKQSKKRSSAGTTSEHPEEKGRTKKRSD